MTLDFSEEFSDFGNIEFSDENQKFEYVAQKLLDGMSDVVVLSLEWALDNTRSEMMDKLDQRKLEVFLKLGLIVKLADHARQVAGTEIVSSLILKQMRGM